MKKVIKKEKKVTVKRAKKVVKEVLSENITCQTCSGRGLQDANNLCPVCKGAGQI